MPHPNLWVHDLSLVCRFEMASSENRLMLHASCVAYQGRGVLVLGRSGSGKSGLCLQLMGLGAGLVADDQTQLWQGKNCVMADAPATIKGQIEARGVGILNAPAVGPVPVALVVDMNALEKSRLPDQKEITLLAQCLPLLHNPEMEHFPAAILTYLGGM